MPVHTVCPACRTEYDLADHLGGKRVVCRQCQQAFEVPDPAADAAPADAVHAADRPAPTVAAGRPQPGRPAPRRPEFEDDDLPPPRREAPAGLIAGIVVIVLVLLLGAAGVGVYALRPAPAPGGAEPAADVQAMPPGGGPRGMALRGGRRPPAANDPSPQAQLTRGDILRERGAFEEAIKAYREAIRLKPDFAEAHSHLGLALEEEGFYKDAEAACRKGVELKPNSAPELVSLGRVLLRNFQYKEAEASLRQAIALQPGDPLAVCQLGLTLQSQGRFPEALEELRRGDAMGRQAAGWGWPSALWVQECERLIDLDRRLPACLAGTAELVGPIEYVDLVNLCCVQKHYNAAAARFATQIPADDPQLPPEQRHVGFYNGACGAALASAGKGGDARHLPDKAAVMLRRQALTWLRRELANEAQKAAQNQAGLTAEVRRQMRHWKQDPDLTSVREPKALDALPAEEQAAWRQLWVDVDALLSKASQPQ